MGKIDDNDIANKQTLYTQSNEDIFCTLAKIDLRGTTLKKGYISSGMPHKGSTTKTSLNILMIDNLSVLFLFQGDSVD